MIPRSLCAARRLETEDTISHFIRIAAIGSLALVGCRDSPTQPNPSMGSELTITVSGSLAATSSLVSAGEAALLFDGTEVAHKICGSIVCHSLDLSVSKGSSRGSHAIEIRLIWQTCDFLPCGGSSNFGFSGDATVYKAGSVVQQILLDPQTRPLSEGDRITIPSS
jgi:hypothetical protein